MLKLDLGKCVEESVRFHVLLKRLSLHQPSTRRALSAQSHLFAWPKTTSSSTPLENVTGLIARVRSGENWQTHAIRIKQNRLFRVSKRKKKKERRRKKEKGKGKGKGTWSVVLSFKIVKTGSRFRYSMTQLSQFDTTFEGNLNGAIYSTFFRLINEITLATRKTEA